MQSVPRYFQGFHFPFGQLNINFKVKNCEHFDNFFVFFSDVLNSRMGTTTRWPWPTEQCDMMREDLLDSNFKHRNNLFLVFGPTSGFGKKQFTSVQEFLSTFERKIAE